MGNSISQLSEEKRTEVAMQMVIMDAMEKGHTNKDEIIQFMSSLVFEKQVNEYKALMSA